MPHCQCQCHTHETPTQDNTHSNPTQPTQELSENKLTFQINPLTIKHLISFFSINTQSKLLCLDNDKINILLKVLSGYNELREINQNQFNTIINQQNIITILTNKLS